MGIYTFYVGKGIIFPVSYFVYKFKKEFLHFEKKFSKSEDSTYHSFEDIILEVVKSFYTKDRAMLEYLRIEILGHDAFYGRDGLFDLPALDRSSNEEALQVVKRTYGRYDKHEVVKRICGQYSRSFMFIGFCHPLDIQLGWSVDCSEFLYSLPGFFKQMEELIKHYSELKINLEKISSHQKPCIWTFATDCCGCCT